MNMRSIAGGVEVLGRDPWVGLLGARFHQREEGAAALDRVGDPGEAARAGGGDEAVETLDQFRVHPLAQRHAAIVGAAGRGCSVRRGYVWGSSKRPRGPLVGTS